MAGLSAPHIRTDSGRAISLDQRIAELKPLYGIAPDPAEAGADENRQARYG